jgi:uncharacterized protein YdaU (DUF1376 family)
MSKSPAFQFYPDKWQSHTRRLSDSGYRVYHELLCWMWQHSPDQCSIEANIDAVSCAVVMPSEVVKNAVADIQNAFAPLLQCENGRWVSNGLRKEVEKQAKHSESAKHGASARWKHANAQKDHANAQNPQCIPSPSPSPTPSKDIPSTGEPVAVAKKKRKTKDWWEQPDPLEKYPELADFYSVLISLIGAEHQNAFKIPEGEDEYRSRLTLAQLVYIDGYSPVDVICTLRWVFEEKQDQFGRKQAIFWRGVIQSIIRLRKIGTNSGASKFAQAHEQRVKYA